MGLGTVIAIDAINDEDVRHARKRLTTHQPTGKLSQFCQCCGRPWPCTVACVALHVEGVAKAAGRIGSPTGGER